LVIGDDEELRAQEFWLVVLQGINHSKQLSVLDRIYAFCWGHGLGEVANGFPSTVMVLEK
jgi:hypothetical protein